MTAPTWPALLSQLLAGTDLTTSDTTWVMDRILGAEATDAQLAGFAVALRAKGETSDEVKGLAASMLGHARRFEVPVRSVDIVGTGGDRSNTVNISTMASVVVAAAGATVVKHGNRASSSKSGSADLLEGLGVALTLSPAGVAASVAEVGIGFCFASAFHPSMRFAAAARRELAIPTFFNILGPLTNPAQPAAGAIGCGDRRLAPVMAGVFADRNAEVLLFRGDDGLDEITTTTTSRVWQVQDHHITEHTVDPVRWGVERVDPEALVGGEISHNVGVARELFAGADGPVRDAVVINAAAALAAHAGFGDSLEDDLVAGLERARTALDSGAASAMLDRWVQVSNRLAAAETADRS